MNRKNRPVVVAIAGGSGSGKTWLAERLERALAPHVVRISMDDFYLDRSHLTLARRARLNFDHPRALDWPTLEQALRHLRSGRTTACPRYDFSTHCRLKTRKVIVPKPIVLVEGLWPLRRLSLRRLFDLQIFLQCQTQVRLRRRLARDLAGRGRSRTSVREQFWRTVEPMHRSYVEPQARWADLVLRGAWGRTAVRTVVSQITALPRSLR